MSEAPAAAAPSLGDFFKAKSKKKLKASNLNKDTTTVKTDEKKAKTKSAEDDQWEEEQITTTTMKVEVAGKLTREEEKTDEQDTAAPAWGNLKQGKQEQSAAGINEKKYPTLAKAVQSSSINIDDGSDSKVNIATSKNHFAALEGDEDDDEEGAGKRPKEIKPAMVQKKKGEREKVALQREVDKYSKKDKNQKKAKGSEDDDDDDEEEEAEAEEAAEPVPAAEEEARKTKKPKRKDDEDDKAKKDAPAEPEEEEEEDLKIVVDLVAAKEKYKGRKKLPPKEIPLEELEEEKENKPKPQVSGKKKKFAKEDVEEKKMLYADDGW